MTADQRHRMPPQMWAFLGSMAAGAAALPFAVLGELGWAAACLVVAIGTGVAARVWSHRSPAPMPHWMRWVLFLPRTSQSADRLKAILQPQPGERLLEIGPGVGIHALPVGIAVAPAGILHVLDVQWEMLTDLRRRAAQAAINNIREVVGDAQRLPYLDRSFDAAYLISYSVKSPTRRRRSASFAACCGRVGGSSSARSLSIRTSCVSACSSAVPTPPPSRSTESSAGRSPI